MRMSFKTERKSALQGCRMGLALCFLSILALPVMAWALPAVVTQEGVVMTNDGIPVEGVHDIRVRLYETSDAVLPFFDERHLGVEFTDGYYKIDIGSIDPLDPLVFERTVVYLGVTLDNQPELVPRTAFHQVPSAMIADFAKDVRGKINPQSVAIPGVGTVINDRGEWVGSNIGLRGPEGPQGPEGPRGPEGPAGDVVVVETAEGSQELADVVLTQLDAQDNPPFLRRNRDDTTTGNYVFQGGSISFTSLGGGAASLNLNNNNVTGVNQLSFADPGPDGAIVWAGTNARIWVGPANGEEGDGPLRLGHRDHGVAVDGDLLTSGNLTVTGAQTIVQGISGTVGSFNAVTVKDAVIETLVGPNNRVTVDADIALNRNLVIGENTNFIGTIRTGELNSAGKVIAAGEVSGQTVTATGSIIAGANVESGLEGRLNAGAGGIFVRNRQVFDGNGNLLAKPSYGCPPGTVMYATDVNGDAKCASVACDAGTFFQGWDGQMQPVCGQDQKGITALPAIDCPAGQGVVGMEPNGRVKCGITRGGDQVCPENQFVIGFDAGGSVICDVIPEPEVYLPVYRPQVLVCGQISLDLDIVLRDSGLPAQVESGCEPTDQTQTFIVTRDGADGYDVGLVRSYVRAGGIIISEFGNSYKLFNDLFETNYPRGERYGNCGDNVNPPVRLNGRNIFWLANDDVGELEGISGCGHDIGNLPEVTFLGGWQEDRPFLGYRDFGLGRLWLADVDWGDGGESMTEGSKKLVGYMATHGRREGDLFQFSGIQENVPDSKLLGWYQCYSSRYSDSNLSLADIKQRCNGDKLMLGCRAVGAANWTLLAQGVRNEVLVDTGDGNNDLNRHNGVDWYFSNNWSMGFVEPGSGVSRNRCDTLGEPNRSRRLCWNTENARLMAGFRCGARTNLNAAGDWERAWFTNRLSTGGGDVFRSCQDAKEAGQTQSGVYDILPPGAAETRRVYCDMRTDGGGWTLVASSRNETIKDQLSTYHEDLASLSPGSANRGVWMGLRGFEQNFDVRFACRGQIGGTADAMDVDLSFYDVDWYKEWTTGSDAESCFEEANGQGATLPAPRRRNNISLEELPEGDEYSGGFLEGEDSCDDVDDFTVDFDDRGMSGDPFDGTDWGAADGCQKCGGNGCLNEGQWFVFVREREIVVPPVDIDNFSGILQDVSDADLDSWCECYTERYAENETALATMVNRCNGAKIMYGCRPAGNDDWSVLAMGDRDQVFTNTGDDNNITNIHNGVAWYFSANESVGFAPVGVPIRRASCDTDNTQGAKKLCWHTKQGVLSPGWRCGAETGLNTGLGWERSVWTRSGGTCVDPPACANDDECAGNKTCQGRRCLDAPPECLFDLDCAQGFVCEAGQCNEFVPECTADTDCLEENQICFESRCLAVSDPPECSDSSECPGERCYRNRCVPFERACAEAAECLAEEICGGGVCRLPCAAQADCINEDQRCEESGFCDWIPLGDF